MDEQTEAKEKQEYQFQAEMSHLLHLITHSLYTHREIFLRELISNAADALNKLHFLSLTDQTVLKEDAELKIDIKLDEDKKTFAITDNGIGMTHDELIENIGTIASSGTGKFFSKLTGDNKKDLELIGQFGVGFYAVFMVADEVTLDTRSYKSDQGYRWTSSGTGSYTIEPIDMPKRGTTVAFTFKKEAEEFASKWRLESTIKKYSDFVSYPISLNEEKTNKSTAIWARPKNEVTEEEYNEFFKYIANTTEDPMSCMHLSVEAPVQFKAIMYIPKQPDKFQFTQDLDTRIHLYVKRVFIQNDCKELIPQWLRFVKGIVDSEDLNLNISREVTQKNVIMEKINKYLVRKLIGEFTDWAEKDREKYNTFWKNFGTFIKEGIHMDFANREKLIELYRCYSSYDPEKLTSLKEYTERMGPDQDEIYYVYGRDRESIENSPNIEYFRKNNIEVLYLYDEVDDFIMPSIGQYREKNLVGVDKADLNLKKDQEKDKKEEEGEALSETAKKKLLGYFKDILGDRVEDVIESKRLVDSACTLVSPKDGMNANMERMMKMMDENFKGGKRVMEINLDNPLIKTLSKIQEKYPQDKLLRDCIEQLYEGASLLDGTLESPSKMVPRSTSIMEKAAELYFKSIEEKTQ